MGVEPGMALNQMTMEGGVDKAKASFKYYFAVIKVTKEAPTHLLSSLNPSDLTRAHWPYVYLHYICSKTRLIGFGFG